MSDNVNKNVDNVNFLGPQEIDGEMFEGDGLIGDALDTAIQEVEEEKQTKKATLKTKAAKKRQTKNQAKKEMGIRGGKQSKYPTRSHSFLGEAISDRAIHVVLNQSRSEVYKDGADVCPRIMMGIPAYNKPSKKNAFEHLIALQEKIKDARGENPKNAPKWIIISNDSSMIMDRNIITRLEELRPTTHAAGAYGFESIRASGRWYQVDASDQSGLRGCYLQGNMDSVDWDFIVGSKFRESPRYRIQIVHGPFIAIRGETFMTIDFTDMAENTKKGFYHYMADISMECYKRGLMCAQIKTACMQFDNITMNLNDADVQHDQSYFTSRWQSELPASIYNK